ITSYHAMLGCVVAGMGISLMPRNVLTTFPDAKLLSVHSLPPALTHAPTSLIRRKGVLSPKVSALIEILLAHSDVGKKRRATHKNGQGARAPHHGPPPPLGRDQAPRHDPPRHGRQRSAAGVKSSDCTRRPRDASAARRRSP